MTTTPLLRRLLGAAVAAACTVALTPALAGAQTGVGGTTTDPSTEVTDGPPSTDDPEVFVPLQAPGDPVGNAARQPEPPAGPVARKDVPLGAALNWGAFQAQTPDGAIYRKTFEEHFDRFSPEIEMKMDRLWPTMPLMLGSTTLLSGIDFREMDRIAAYARKAGKTMRGHTLVWCTASTKGRRSQGDPPWLGAFDLLYRTPTARKAALRAMLKMYIQRVVRRYDDVVSDWDVTNEFFEDPTSAETDGDGRYRGCFWTRELGASVIEDSFRWAREATKDPLYLNEVGLDFDNDASRFALGELRRMKTAGVPIDGFGFEMHAPIGGIGLLSFPQVQEQFRRFTALGLDLQVTEMDVPFDVAVPAYDPESAEAEIQRQLYANVAAACQAESRCKGFTTWGVGDRHTFRDGAAPAGKHFVPLAFDRDWKPKRAWTEIVSRLGG